MSLYCIHLYKISRLREGMKYRQVSGALSPSPNRTSAELPPIMATFNNDAKTLEVLLQQMDETFYDNNNNNDTSERWIRLRQLEERQTALKNLCEAALRQEENNSSNIRLHEKSLPPAETSRRMETGIVSTPRSLESFSIYDESAMVGRSISRNGAISSTMLAPPPPLPPRAATREEIIENRKQQSGELEIETRETNYNYRGKVRSHLRPPSATTTTGTIPFCPLPSPPLFEKDENNNNNASILEEDRHIVETFLQTTQTESRHPYAAETIDKFRLPLRVVSPIISGRLSRFPNGDTGINQEKRRRESQENFDVNEDEELIKKILLQENQTSQEVSHEGNSIPYTSLNNIKNNIITESVKNGASMQKKAESARSVSSSSIPYPNYNKSKNHVSTLHQEDVTEYLGEGKGEEDTQSNHVITNTSTNTALGDIQELVQENQTLHKELEKQDYALRELTQKTESLARHLVKSLREKTQLQYRVEKLEELLENANTEVGKLRKAAETQSELSCSVAGWRAAVHAKERELRICEDELARLRGIIEQRVIRPRNTFNDKENSITLDQVHNDLDTLLNELATAHLRQREAETHAARVVEELEAAQLHIQLLDSRLAEAEKAAVMQRLREMQERILPGEDASLLLTLTLPSEEDIAAWPIGARREIARLASHAEKLVLHHSESDRHAELRLSHARLENDELRARCRTQEEEMKVLEEEVEILRREKITWNSSERRWYQQLLDVQDDAALLSELLQSTSKNAESFVQSIIDQNIKNRQELVEIEAFITKLMRNISIVERFFTALQRMKLVNSNEEKNQKKLEEKLPLSVATKARKEFLLRAVELAMTHDATSSIIQKKQKDQEQQVEFVTSTLPLLESSFKSYNSEKQEKEEEEEEEIFEKKNFLFKEKVLAPPLSPTHSFIISKESIITSTDNPYLGISQQKNTVEDKMRPLIPPPPPPPPPTPPSPSPSTRSIFPPFSITASQYSNISKNKGYEDVTSSLYSSSQQYSYYDYKVEKRLSPPKKSQYESFTRLEKKLPISIKKDVEESQILQNDNNDNQIILDVALCTTPSTEVTRTLQFSVAVNNTEKELKLTNNNEKCTISEVQQSVALSPPLSLSHNEEFEEIEEEEVMELIDRNDESDLSNEKKKNPIIGVNPVKDEKQLTEIKEQDKNQETSTNQYKQSDISIESKEMKNSIKVNKISRTALSSTYDDFNSEPRLGMGPPQRRNSDLKRLSEQEQQQQQEKQRQESLNLVMKNNNNNNSVEIKDSVIVPVSDTQLLQGVKPIPVPVSSKSIIGKRSGGLAPTLSEPQRPTLVRSTSIISNNEISKTTPVSSTNVTPVTATESSIPLNSQEIDVNLETTKISTRRPSATMDFPSLRAPTIGPGRRKVGEASISTSNSEAHETK